MKPAANKLGQPAAPAKADLVKDATTASFAGDVIEASRSALIIADFWANWCQPCKQLTPLLEKVVKSYGGGVRLVKINVDEQPAIANQLRIQSLPTVYAFRDGRPLDGFVGARPESAIKAFIDGLLGPDLAADAAAVLAEAAAALEVGDVQTAATLYATLLEEDKQSPAALAGLARCYLKSGDLERAEHTLALVPPQNRDAAPVSSVRAALGLARKAGGTAKRKDYEARLEANPADHAARFDLAVELAAHDHKEAAVDNLLAIVRQSPSWNDGAAREQLVELFNAWGPQDPVTRAGRRRLSSLLFS